MLVRLIPLLLPCSLLADTALFQNDLNGFQSVVDTRITRADVNRPGAADATISVDRDDLGHPSLGLIRFDVFGTGIGQIPAGSTITRATLRLYTLDSSVGVQSFHAMLRTWDETATWRLLGNRGIEPDGVNARPDASARVEKPVAGKAVEIDLTKDLAAWSENPEGNLGWVILNGSSDGWDFAASEYRLSETGTLSDRRPLLTVEYTPAPSSLSALSLPELNPTGATLTWKTPVPANAAVEYGKAPDKLDGKASGDDKGANQHAITLEKLTPGTTYHFRVTSQGPGGFLAHGGGTFTTPDARVVRGPYLQIGSPDGATIHWRISAPGTCRVRFGTSPDKLDRVVEAPQETSEPVIRLEGLQPATNYFYQIETTFRGGLVVKSPDPEQTTFKTYPAPGTDATTRVWVIGDSGTANPDSRAVYEGFASTFPRDESPRADVWLMLGDNAYDHGTDAEFQHSVFETYPELLRNTFVWPALGNHEAYTVIDGVSAKPFFDIFDMPTKGESGGVASGTERYYSFNHANVHFICLDSETKGNYDDKPGGGGQYDWLEADLQACEQDWIIVYFHHPPYTKGSHDSDREIKHIEMRRHFLPLLESYGADLMLGGHSHCYERSNLITGHHGEGSTSDTFNPAPVAEGGNVVDAGNGSLVGGVDAAGNFLTDARHADGAYEKPVREPATGTVYTVAGASGKISPWQGASLDLVNPSPHPVHLVNLRLLGSMVLEIDGLTLHARYLGTDGKVRDDFTIRKSR